VPNGVLPFGRAISFTNFRIFIRTGQPFDALALPACSFDGLRVPSGVEWTPGLQPAYPEIVKALVAEARRMGLSRSRDPCVVHFLRFQSSI
jgi:hypothetical protein